MDEETVSAACIATRQSALHCRARLGDLLLAARAGTVPAVSHGLCCPPIAYPKQTGKTARNGKHLCETWLPYTSPDTTTTRNKSSTVCNHPASSVLSSAGSSHRWSFVWPAIASESLDDRSTEQRAVEVAGGFWLDVILPREEGEELEAEDRGYTHYTQR